MQIRHLNADGGYYLDQLNDLLNKKDDVIETLQAQVADLQFRVDELEEEHE